MRLLLDSHVLVWWIDDNPRLGLRARQAVGDPNNEIFVSVASIWELAIVRAKGNTGIPGSLAAICELERFSLLPIEPFHAEQAASLPLHHRDPFDRMLVAQAQVEGLTIVTQDAAIPRYGVRTMAADR